MKLEITHDWPWLNRLNERLFPGINGQADRWGRVTRSRLFLGGLIELEATVADEALLPSPPKKDGKR